MKYQMQGDQVINSNILEEEPSEVEDRVYLSVDADTDISDDFLTTDSAKQSREIIPGWVKSKTQVGERVADRIGHSFQTAAFHFVRCPTYLVRLVCLAPYGLAMILVFGGVG